MNIVLWVLQGLLAALFVVAGSMKVFMFERICSRSPRTMRCPVKCVDGQQAAGVRRRRSVRLRDAETVDSSVEPALHPRPRDPSIGIHELQRAADEMNRRVGDGRKLAMISNVRNDQGTNSMLWMTDSHGRRFTAQNSARSVSQPTSADSW